jgi:hypothetical protein
MNISASAAGRPTNRSTRSRNVRRARNFLLIAVMTSLVSLAGHCLPGDEVVDSGASVQSISRPAP